ncbi:MAG: M20/M25/M40 family metallo-hydrolase [Saprospiraceae bacterium]|nr:M20/M25/M40 family metallo-hydrolase [Saprospiraceae bacterium]
MELLTLPDAPPIVFGELKVPGAKRTLMIYVHYDGQPVAYDQWESGSPWSGELYTDAREKGGQKRSFPEAGEKIDPKWRIYGRSASDDKAPFPALLAVLDAFREAGIQPSSPNIGAYYETYKDKLSANAWIVLDGPVHQSGRPQIVYGVRGTAALDITVYGALQHDKIALVHRRGGYPASRTPIDLPISETIIAAIKRIDDRGPVLVPTYGASLPVFHFTRNSEVPLLIIPIANFDNNQHAPDENLRIGNLWFGIELYAALFTMP